MSAIDYIHTHLFLHLQKLKIDIILQSFFSQAHMGTQRDLSIHGQCSCSSRKQCLRLDASRSLLSRHVRHLRHGSVRDRELKCLFLQLESAHS